MQQRILTWTFFACVSAWPCSRADAQASEPKPADTASPAPAPTPGKPSPLPPTAAPSARLLQDDSALSQWVMDHSTDVAAARFDLNAARSVQRGAGLYQNPNIDLSVSNFALGSTNGIRRDKTLLWGAGLSQTFELGKRGPRIAAAEIRTTAAQQRLTATVAERVSQTRLALAQLVYQRARAQELDASLAQARAAAEVAKGRLDHQAMSGVDYDRLLIDLAGIETESAHAHADAEAAEAQCAATLFAPCDLADTDVAVLEPAASVPASWDPGRIKERADIQATLLEADASKRDADLAAARAIPDLTFRLGYAHEAFNDPPGNLNDSLSLSVQAPLPLFDRGQHAKSEALAHASQSLQEARGTIVRARGDVTALFTRKRAVEGALQRLESDALPRANGVLEAEERGLREGQLDITDLLLARREAIALRLQTLDLHFELFNVRNELRQALGLDESLAQR